MSVPAEVRRTQGDRDKRVDRVDQVDRDNDVEQRAGPASDHAELYWRTHIQIGFGVFLGEAVAILVYLGLTPHGRHRPILYGMAIAWLLFALGNLLFVTRLAASHWRVRFSVTWTVLASFAIAGFAVLDGGMNSPVVILLFLPISFAALAFTPSQALLCGASTLASAAILTNDSTGSKMSEGAVAMLLAALAGASVLCVTAAVNRLRRERHEQHLLAEIVTLGSTDGLTGCVVHRVLHEHLQVEIARAQRHLGPLSLMLVDVDNFKRINDTYGHLVGDNTLAAVGSAIRSRVRAIDLVGRIGGDEFAVLLPETEPEDAVLLAESIRSELPALVEVPVTLSIGVSGIDRTTPTSERMLDDADFALYKVKRAGRDAVALQQPQSAPPVT